MNTLEFDPYKTLKSLLEVTSSHFGIDFLKIICVELKNLFEADLVFITETLNSNPTTKVKILYSTNQDSLYSFDLEGTPCLLTFQNEIIQIKEGLNLTFEKAKDTNFESFYGIPINNKNSVCIGHIGIFSHKKRVIPKEIEDIALLFTRRVEAEYERLIIEKENKKLVKELLELSLVDPLTKLYNRRFFEQKAQEAFNQCNRSSNITSLIFLDLDNFKLINDNYSHEEGDYVLKEIAKIFSKICRKDIDFISRVGGEEFVIISFNTTIINSEKLSKRLMKETSDFFKNKEYEVTFSIGIASFDKKYQSWKEVYSAADKKMYLSKNNGKNMISY